MARLNVYLPDDLATRARASGLNISALTQIAVEAELARGDGVDWLSKVEALPALSVEHDDVAAAVAAARDEFEGRR
jgi:post-segregation antitoxin (ccd killing protein)